MDAEINPDAYNAFQELTDEEWNSLSKDLLAYTVRLVGKMEWRHGLMPKGISEPDIVQILVEKTINGERSWDPDDVDLRTFLFSQIRSIVNHLFDLKEYKHESHLDTPGDVLREMIDREMSQGIEKDTPYSSTPEEILINKNHREGERHNAKEKVSAILEACDGDAELEEVFFTVYGLLEDGHEIRPRHIAERLGVPRTDVYNRIKRLKRRKREVETVMEHESEPEDE